MTPWQNRLTPLIRRMADDMLLRNLAQKTIDSYTYHVGRCAQFLGKPLEEATPEDLRSTQNLRSATPLQSWWPWMLMPALSAASLSFRPRKPFVRCVGLIDRRSENWVWMRR